MDPFLEATMGSFSSAPDQKTEVRQRSPVLDASSTQSHSFILAPKKVDMTPNIADIWSEREADLSKY